MSSVLLNTNNLETFVTLKAKTLSAIDTIAQNVVVPLSKLGTMRLSLK